MNVVISINEMLIDNVKTRYNLVLDELLSRMYRVGKHLLNIINRFLDSSGIVTGKIELHEDTFNTREVIKDGQPQSNPC